MLKLEMTTVVILWTQAVYVTATTPFVLLFILVVRGLTLSHASDGLRFYLTPDLSRLSDVKVHFTLCINDLMFKFALPIIL